VLRRPALEVERALDLAGRHEPVFERKSDECQRVIRWQERNGWHERMLWLLAYHCRPRAAFL
jgi:hypothetical protein